MPIRTLEHLKQSAPNDFLRDFIDTAYHWREQPVAAKRKLTGRIETITEVDVAPEPLPPSVAAPVYWNGVLKRPKVLVDIGEQIGDIGSGALTRLSGSWSLIEYLTQDDGDTRYATRFHAPTHHWDGDDPLSGQQIMDLRIEDRPTWAAATLTEFGTLRDRVGNPAFGALYAAGVTPATTNYVLAMTDAGTETYLGASDKVVLVVGGTSKLTVDVGEMNLASGVTLKMSAITVIDSSRNITGTTVKGLNAAGIGIRPAVALADGTFDDQDAATFRGTISAAAAVHDHTSITGSAAKLTTARSIGMTGDGTWSVSFDGSANVSWAMTLASIIAAGGPVGSATKAPQFTWDSKGRLTAVDEVAITPAWSSITSKPTTFSGLGVTMLASDIPNHASRHHWDGADPISGQSISGLRTTSSPTFYGIIIGDGGIGLGSLVGIGRNGSGGIYMRPSAGVVRLTVEDTNVYCSTAFSANSGQFTNLSTGFVRSNSVGQLSSSSLLASDIPNHASRHEYGGADSLAGQSIAGLRKVDSPSFLNLSLDGALQFSGYNITSYDGDAFYVETSGGWQLIKSTLAEGTIIATGLFPTGNGIECGKNSYRWNFRSNDLNHDCETVTATNTTPGSSIQTIPSTGNYFKLTNGSGGATRNYRIPNAPGSGIGKRLALFSGSSDSDGFTRIYPPSSGQLWNGGLLVTTYVEFNSSAGALKIVMDSDGSNWHI